MLSLYADAGSSADGTETGLWVGLATAVVTLAVGGLHHLQSRLTTRTRAELNEKKLELEAQRQDSDHHQLIVKEYQQLLEQSRAARDFTRAEVHELRAEIQALRTAHYNELKALRTELASLRAGYEADVEGLREAHRHCDAENHRLRDELSELRADLGLIKAANTPGSLTP